MIEAMSSQRDDQLNVLVLDDDEAMRTLLVDLVTRYEHQAVPASTAEEALALLPCWTFQVAFLDHNLPGLEGLLLGEYLRKNNPDMTIALVTGQDDPNLERRSRDLAIRFIAKPFNVAEIMTVIEEHQARARDREEARRGSEDSYHAAPIAEYFAEIEECFDVPSVPARIEERLVQVIKRCVNEMRSPSRYSERDRVMALAGLLAARVLGVSLPRSSSGRTYYEEYDAVMSGLGRKREFSGE
jgi:DNA-binding NtrC family response regulator